MSRSGLERLSREDLIELVLRLQRPEKTSRTSSKPPSTDRKERREWSKPGGAIPSLSDGRSRRPQRVNERRARRYRRAPPDRCTGCGTPLPADLPADVVSVHERLDLPPVAPVVTQGALRNLFGLTLSQGGLMNPLRRRQRRFEDGRKTAISALRRAAIVVSDETGARIEASNATHWVFR